jgi:hypothetical protein
MKLSIALATRRRPGILVRTVNQTLSNITNPDTRLVILADDDDDGTISVQAQLTDPRIIWSIAPRPDSVGEKYNRVIKVCPADVYMVHVDYAPQVTKGFDERVIEAATVYPDGYAIILGHLANLSFSSINAVTAKMAETLGGIYPEYFPYWFVDHWLEDIARRIGRQVFVDALVDCSRKQVTIGKAEPYFWGCLFDWLHLERRQIAERIINSVDFDETPARKRALMRNQTLVDEWGFVINSGLRDEPAGDPPEEERYTRIRKQAEEIIARYQKEHEQAA